MDIYRFTAEPGQGIFFDVLALEGNKFDINALLVEGDDPFSYLENELVFNRDFRSDPGVYVLETGGTYTIAVWRDGDDTGTYTFKVWDRP